METYYEIYSQQMIDGKSMYCLASQNGKIVNPSTIRSGQTGSAPMPFMEIADFNRDGMFDFAFVTETGTMNIVMNQYSSPGPKATNLCSDIGNTSELKSKPIFPSFPFSVGQEGVVQETLEVTDQGIIYNGIAPSIPSTGDVAGIPGRMRISDLNQDGFPDFVMTLAFNNQANSQDLTKTVILLNQQGTEQERSLAQVKADNSDSYLSKVIQDAGDTAELVTFMDIDEDGKLDFVLQKLVNGVP